ncbi:hypothetical protein CLV62_1445 [Dysgonomonas alginatilytica]|uniref:Uncharacterized protein n=1 Tax=Dysgonomonas alginatilytica TaxID=1605892 RepID=A0A2V3PIL8_9BACT|nr:hypothetical protein [Dysgonomonas alginatilytica]PXV58793.1 hypothetical protein CLV62_1445 [Dysgonomonas alginatilytica]
MEQFKQKQNEIDEKLKSFKLTTKEKIKVQEYISRSIVVNYFFVPFGTAKENIIYTDLDNDYYDIGITTTHSSIELKERTQTYQDFIIEEKKLQNLLFQWKPFYVCYALDSNKVYIYDLRNIDLDSMPIEILKCNKNTTESITNKEDKKVRYLDTKLAKVYTVNNINKFIDIKHQYINRLTEETINKKILKK